MNLKVARFNKLSDICSDLALISLASIVIPFAIDKFNPVMLILGVITTITFWLLSLLFVRGNL